VSPLPPDGHDIRAVGKRTANHDDLARATSRVIISDVGHNECFKATSNVLVGRLASMV
jgi:hypothetical protein